MFAAIMIGLFWHFILFHCLRIYILLTLVYKLTVECLCLICQDKIKESNPTKGSFSLVAGHCNCHSGLWHCRLKWKIGKKSNSKRSILGQIRFAAWCEPALIQWMDSSNSCYTWKTYGWWRPLVGWWRVHEHWQPYNSQ